MSRPAMKPNPLFLHLIAAMEKNYILILGPVFCLALLTYFTLNKHQKAALKSRLSLRGRRNSQADTPPRSLSPEEKGLKSSSSSAELVDSFPPNRQAALSIVAEKLPSEQRKQIMSYETEESKWAKRLIPLTTDYRSCDDNMYTPTGISIGQVKALGNFPDYEELSGVPLPKPYSEFEITKAIPRPYRPFRWAYHQTMCESAFVDSFLLTCLDVLAM